jgi:hypothetical protein
MTLPNPGESDIFECSEELGGCGRTFGTHENFADHECSSNSTSALSMLVTHRLVVNGQVASCKCGAWDCRTNEVVEADILDTLKKQYSLHFKQLGVFSK